MNKFLVVLLLAFGAVSSFRIREIPVDQIYDAVVALFKGMAETSECKCAAVLTNNKAQILEIVYAAIDEVKAGTPIETAVQNAALKLMGIDGLVSECNVLAMPAIITKITTKDGLVEIFQTLIDNIDEVIAIIRGSANVAEAKEKLIERFGLSEAQSAAIVEMRLRALTGLEREKLEAEYAELQKKIAEYKAILADEKLLLGVIKSEILEISDKYGDERRTKIGLDDSDLTNEDLIPKENTVIAMTSLGYIKRMTVDNFKAQNRGGKGIKGMKTIEEDYIEDLLMTNTHQSIMFFTNYGRVYRKKAYEIPESSRNSRGVAIVNLLQLQGGEKISAMIPVTEVNENKNLLMVTRKGIVKKTNILEYNNIRKKGLIAITLRDDDELIEVKTTDKDSEIFLVTKQGMCIRFKETDVRSTGRSSMGVIGMNLADDDEIIGMQIDTQGDSLLIVSELGYGKRTELTEFHLQKRGGKGVKCYKIMEKTGDVVGVKAVTNDNEIMMITDQGVIIQLRMEDIKIISRITSGVKMITLDKGVKVAKIAKVREKISDGDRDIDMEDIDDVVINVAKSDEPVVVIHDEIDVDDDEEDTRFDGIEDE